MPPSSTGATCGDGAIANDPRAVSDNATQAAARPRVPVPVPNDPNYSLGRFLDKNKETAPGCQRPGPGFGKMPSDAEAVTEAEARMRKELRTFDAKFFGGSSASK
ncbi:hypothetical protein TGAMA5MH_06865 [Trichoderma gamsii]|uniref:Uncharacterized protein n=1 Tax=Trichoderma gamsii TaxID=398673 RepID=A0A2K0T641_9HYPO|nr:hypothetical protein TGAMA5MH_06865 [Trichoderma gamsii]